MVGAGRWSETQCSPTDVSGGLTINPWRDAVAVAHVAGEMNRGGFRGRGLSASVQGDKESEATRTTRVCRVHIPAHSGPIWRRRLRPPRLLCRDSSNAWSDWVDVQTASYCKTNSPRVSLKNAASGRTRVERKPAGSG